MKKAFQMRKPRPKEIKQLCQIVTERVNVAEKGFEPTLDFNAVPLAL